MDFIHIILFVINIALAIWLLVLNGTVSEIANNLRKLEDNTNSSLQYIRNDIRQLQLSYEDTRNRIDGGIECSTNKYSWTKEKVNWMEENRKLLTDLIYDLGYELDVVGPQPARPARPAHFKLKKPEQKRIKNAKS